MKKLELKKILESHKEWVLSKGRRGKRADLSNADLSNLDLKYVDLSGASLDGANLSNTDLTDANLNKINLSEANLSGANLQVADLGSAYLRRANLTNANLKQASLVSSANLIGAVVTGANLDDIIICGTNLQGVVGMIYICSQYQFASYGYMHNNELRVRLGCFDRTVKEWNNDFWNNVEEYPENSEQGQNRLMIYKFMKEWLYKNFPGLE